MPVQIAPPHPMRTSSLSTRFFKNTDKRKLIDPMNHANNVTVYRSILLTIKIGDATEEENELENHRRVHCGRIH